MQCKNVIKLNMLILMKNTLLQNQLISDFPSVNYSN